MTTSRDSHDLARCTFIPPWLTERVDGADQADRDDALRMRRGLDARSARTPALDGVAEGTAWTVHDAGSGTSLPGAPARSSGEPATGDVAVDEASVGIEATLAMFAEEFDRESHDGAGSPVSLTVHYGRDYNNAFWDGTQLVFGDGDGETFERFTKPVDVLAHEFGHGVIEHTADLTYSGQSGALNESVADVFAACLKQRLLSQDAAEGDWLIGEGIFTPAVRARGLRDMAAPGTAYDDPGLGADPQVGHMDDYVVTASDNGGVHLNSGIPNRAFQLAAVGIGGSAIEGAGRIWYAALTGGDVSPRSDFADFAAATIAAAGPHADVVRRAWAQVGVSPDAATPASTSTSTPAPGSAVVGVLRVRRTGGFAGMTTSSEVDLAGRDPATALVRDLLGRADLAAARGGDPRPDMFVYEFQLGDDEPIRVQEQDLTDDLATLARTVLGLSGGVDIP